MALISRKKNTKAEVAVVKGDKKVAGASVTPTKSLYAGIIVSPRITEKAGLQSTTVNAYTFVISKKATKRTVALAIKETYKVTPVKVNIIRLPGKEKFKRGHFSTSSDIKKAVVYLKKGDKIEFI